ncbi:YbaB/EbfC family nucleoid-associated protein [Streptomyces antarcticus]|uniref:YbaB/EbfC family nucleoid-associated protein n=1 Tax=Streptomyces antarcticus TaxID=2996458 RepID=UPI002271B8F4|nr:MULTISPECIES: YbaB/EbfC family nucleoid-associated protein [unclassified Streptomyces]MCY0941821.1 YbaB/EbfC family nucleoid-associated protein [Streptomyces sp. H34-AA3]MCY0949244.1 YbaB/EbfC family nucleoid-associated protein [Streptomyces sp. H27-S2]MCZ4086815.1 YbaB/EbfC family nucleoid-associated protein [Streptomyces sp. H34-S5]
MTEPIEQRIAKAMAELESVKAAVARAEEQLADATATVRSRDRAVEVTVGPQGELAGLKFLDGKHLSMNASQLAASVMEAAGRGRAQMARQVMELFDPLTRSSATVPELSGVDIDWDRIFGSALRDEDDGGRVRRPGDRLRDEILEDTDDGHRGRDRS